MDTILFYSILNGYVTEVNMPDIVSIGQDAFHSCYALTSVNFPACTTISQDAFHSCYALTSVNFPVCTKISDWAFAYCSALTSVSFPVCTFISTVAFRFCTALTTASFPACTTIGTYAFESCHKLTNVSFPACTLIYENAFSNCYKLISLYLTGSSVCRLRNSGAFYSTPIGGYSTSAGQFGSIYVPASLLASYQAATYWTYFSDRFIGLTPSQISAYNGSSIIGASAFAGVSWLKTANFQSCTSIYSYAFQRCENLTTASFESLVRISGYAFRSCYNLTQLYLMGPSVVSITTSTVFTSTPIGGYSGSAGGYGSIYVPASLLTSYKTATYWTYFSSRFVGI